MAISLRSDSSPAGPFRAALFECGENLAKASCAHGVFYYNPNDVYVGASLEQYGEYSELELQRLLALVNPGAVAVEVGANIGGHTVPLARKLGARGRLWAFEPQPTLFRTLCANLLLNGLTNVSAYPFAIGSSSEPVQIDEPDYDRPGNFGAVGTKPLADGDPIPCVRLDDFLPVERLHLLRVDAAGSGQRVLEGTTQLIKRHRPVLFVEAGCPEGSPSLIRFVSELGYRVFWDVQRMFNPENLRGDSHDIFQGQVSVNLLGIPVERRLGALEVRAISDPEAHPLAGRPPRPDSETRQELVRDEDEPDEPQAETASASSLRRRGCPAAAVAQGQRALTETPEDPQIWFELGAAYRDLRQFGLAVEHLRRAHELEPGSAEFLHDLGVTLQDARLIDEAVDRLRLAAQLEPANGEYRFSLALALLHQGHYEEGFEAYEKRLDRRDPSSCPSDRPTWKGEPLAGRTVLIHSEQAFGDMIQFARFIPEMIQRRDGTIKLECPRPLARLFERLDPSLEVTVSGSDMPAHDLTASIASLPWLLRKTEITDGGPYLSGARDSPLLSLIRPSPNLKVGLTWAGRLLPKNRSCPFETFLGLLETPRVDFYSLQRGGRARDIFTHGCGSLLCDLSGELRDFADDATVVEQLDLVITVDTAMCHLAGALGKPTWTLLTYDSDWRFGSDEHSTVWYSSMRLFRQPRPDDWDTVIKDVKESLRLAARG